MFLGKQGSKFCGRIYIGCNESREDGILKSRDITLPTKVHLVKTGFSRVIYGCESWAIKKAEH